MPATSFIDLPKVGPPVCTENPIRVYRMIESVVGAMIALICFVLAVLASPFKSNIRFEAENAVLRHQVIVLRRKLKGRARLTNNDRWFLVQLYRWFPSILPVLMVIRPETLVRWHRAGFRRYWRWKSHRRGGRPQIETELRALIRQMSTENLLWGAPATLLHFRLQLSIRVQKNPASTLYASTRDWILNLKQRTTCAARRRSDRRREGPSFQGTGAKSLASSS